jgi:hypothetical protein
MQYFQDIYKTGSQSKIDPCLSSETMKCPITTVFIMLYALSHSYFHVGQSQSYKAIPLFSVQKQDHLVGLNDLNNLAFN